MRLFIAIDTSKEIQNYLFQVQKQFNQNLAKIRVVNSFHLTYPLFLCGALSA